ncbi:MAG: hypothetical protein C5B58_02820 [Acidobacteria bacterium]|nr:MAG: hypothetical protein C5B58_02820 [Acidobacteriota bacterium]
MYLEPHRVFCARTPKASYKGESCSRFPELGGNVEASPALLALRSLLIHAGLDKSGFNSPDWNPFGDLIREGERVLIKPNWVNHRNPEGSGLECLVTDTSVLEAILHYVAKTRPRCIVLGDAPIQGCDFDRLLLDGRVNEMVNRFKKMNVALVVKDFRRTIQPDGVLGGRALENCRSIQDFILYDLGFSSLVDEITTLGSNFRVAMYDPAAMQRTHARGKHQYLIARDAIEADVVINVPKLKTHKKAGLTGALKNVVGINGHKEYLPHHRKGGSGHGGDCYPGRSGFKRIVESLFDATNSAHSNIARRFLANAVRAGVVLGKAMGKDDNYEGAWHGNDTVWRMTLDLQRVLHYGRTDGTVADDIQRRVITITDAIIAGEGEGPLRPSPVGLKMLTMGTNPASVEWVHALLMGLDPYRIPLIRQAFSPNGWSVATFSPHEIIVTVDGQRIALSELFSRYGHAFRPPAGWKGYIELGTSEAALQFQGEPRESTAGDSSR